MEEGGSHKLRSFMPLRSVRTLTSVWDKNTLFTGSVSGAGADPQTLKNGVIFSWHIVYQFIAINN